MPDGAPGDDHTAPEATPFADFLRALDRSLHAHRQQPDIDRAETDRASSLLVLLRAPSLDVTAYRVLLAAARPLCDAAHATLISHTDGVNVNGDGKGNRDGDFPIHPASADGVHLNGRALRRYRQRPVAPAFLLSAACHNAAELEMAISLGVDFVTLSPVLPTQTHPDATPLGWKPFAALCETVSVPVYGMGGLSPADLPRVRAAGGYGVAAIRGLWHAAESTLKQRSE
jgi:thiamine monophosphate synthase